MLDALVLADWAVEDDALPGIRRRLAQRRAADADRLGCDQDSFRIESMKDQLEPFAFGADPVGLWYRHVVEENHVGVDGMASHLGDRPYLDMGAIEMGVEQTQALGLPLHLIERRGAREDQRRVGDLGGRDPDLLPLEDISFA